MKNKIINDITSNTSEQIRTEATAKENTQDSSPNNPHNTQKFNTTIFKLFKKVQATSADLSVNGEKTQPHCRGGHERNSHNRDAHSRGYDRCGGHCRW